MPNTNEPSVPQVLLIGAQLFALANYCKPRLPYSAYLGARCRFSWQGPYLGAAHGPGGAHGKGRIWWPPTAQAARHLLSGERGELAVRVDRIWRPPTAPAAHHLDQNFSLTGFCQIMPPI